MGIKCILLYKLPKGVHPSKQDAERIINVLTDQLCCIPVEGRGLSGADKQLEAIVSIFKQTQAPDLSVVPHPTSLREVWMYRLTKEAPNKAYLMLKGSELRITEADPNVRTFLEKRLEYRQRAQVAIQSHSWVMGDKHSDVTIKLLQVSQNAQTPKVLAVEVTYHPAVDLAAGQPVLAELAERISSLVAGEAAPVGHQGVLQMLDPKYSKFNSEELPPTFGPMHTAVAYNELLAEGLGAR